MRTRKVEKRLLVPYPGNWMRDSRSRDLLKRFWEYRSKLRLKTEAAVRSIHPGIEKIVYVKKKSVSNPKTVKKKI